jgi:protein-L-isoaspartate(D-aspartate) O-methyltransferase
MPPFRFISAALVTLISLIDVTSAFQDAFLTDRRRMVAEQIASRDVRDPRVLAAMGEVPRHLFIAPGYQSEAYEDSPLPIGYGQTISQPYIVALMTELARPRHEDRALEVGTGSGYQAAVLSRLVSHVYTVELVEPLGLAARDRLKNLGYANVTVRVGDGYAGWPEMAPFDIIMVTAAPDHIPEPLVAQLKPRGRLVVPVGAPSSVQELQVVEKDEAGRTTTRRVAPVQFVPLLRAK